MRESSTLDLKQYIRDIPDFPKPGILFRDITPLLICPTAFRECVRRMADHFRHQAIDVIVAAEARVHFRRSTGPGAGDRLRPHP